MTAAARPLRLSTADAGFEAAFQARLHWSAETGMQVEEAVTAMLADVQRRGDTAVLEYTNRFDGLQAASIKELEIGQDVLKAAFDALPSAQRDALQTAAHRI